MPSILGAMSTLLPCRFILDAMNTVLPCCFVLRLFAVFVSWYS